MRKYIILLLASLFVLGAFSACEKKQEPQKGEMFLETAAKNSAQAKQAEADVQKAMEQTQKTVDDAMKKAQEAQ